MFSRRFSLPLAAVLFVLNLIGCGAQLAESRFRYSTLPQEAQVGQTRAEVLFDFAGQKERLNRIADHAAEVSRLQAWCTSVGFDYGATFKCADDSVDALYHAEKAGFTEPMIRELAREAHNVFMTVSALTSVEGQPSQGRYWYALRAAQISRLYGLGRDKETEGALTAARRLSDQFEKDWNYKYGGIAHTPEDFQSAPEPRSGDLKLALQILDQWQVPGDEAQRTCKLVREKGYSSYLSSWHRNVVSRWDDGILREYYDPFLLEQCGGTPEPDDFERFGLQDDADAYLEVWDLAVLQSLSRANLIRFARAEISYCHHTANEILANSDSIWGQVIALDQCARARLIYTAASEDVFQRVLNAEEAWVYLMAYYDVYTRATAEMEDCTPGDLGSQLAEKRRVLEQALGLAKTELRQSYVADAEARLAALK